MGISVALLAVVALVVVLRWPSSSGVLKYPGKPTHLQYSSDGTRLYAGGSGGIVVWDTANRKLVATLGESEKYTVFTLSPDGSRLAATAVDPKVFELDVTDQYVAFSGVRGTIWDVKAGTVVAELTQLLPDCDRFAPYFSFTRDGQQVALACQEKTSGKWRVRVMDLGRKALAREFITGDGGYIPWVAFVDGDRKLMSITNWSVVDKQELPGMLVVWNMETGKSENGTLLGLSAFTTADVSPTGSLVVVGQMFTAKAWDSTTGDGGTSHHLSRAGNRVALTSDNRYVLTGDNSKEGLIRFDCRTWQKTTLGSSRISCLAVSRDGQMVACGCGNSRLTGSTGHVEVWDIATGKQLHTFASNAALITAVAFRPDGKQLASADPSGMVDLWDLP